MAKPKKEKIVQGTKKNLILLWECGECRANNIADVSVRDLASASLETGSNYGNDTYCSCYAQLELRHQTYSCINCGRVNKIYPE